MIKILKRDSGLLQKLLLTALSRGFAATGTLGFNFVLARVLGTEEYGLFMLAIAILTGFSILIQFGLPTAVLRFTGIYSENNDKEALQRFQSDVTRFFIVSSLLVGLVMIAAKSLINGLFFGEKDFRGVISLMALTLPFYGYVTIQSAYLKGFKRPELAPFFEIGLVGLNSACLILTLQFFGVLVNSLLAGACLLASSLTVVLVGRAVVARIQRAMPLSNVSKFGNRVNLISLLPDYAVASLITYALQFSPALVLGVFASGRDVGLYSVANNIAFIVSFVLWIVEAVTAPRFAALYSDGKKLEMRILLRKAVTYMLFMAIPVLLILLVYAEKALLLFGQEYVEAKNALILIACCHFYAVVVGPVNFILNMTGHQKSQRNIVILSAVISIGSAIWFVPQMGFMGAAVSTSLGIVTRFSFAFKVAKDVMKD